MSYHPSDYAHDIPFVVRSGTPDRAAGMEQLGEHAQPMRDGVVLRADVYLPVGAEAEAFPTVLIRMPYGKRTPAMGMAETAGWLARKGYACVVQDVRGKFASAGAFEPMRNEVADGVDTVDWVAAQPWSDGRVGMWGESYYGYTALAAAVGGHPALRCIAPGDIASDRWRCVYRQGALQLNTHGYWAVAMDAPGYVDVADLDPWHLPLATLPATIGAPGGYYRQLLDHVDDEAWWSERSLAHRLNAITVPVLFWSGWYDNFSGPQIDDFTALRATAPAPGDVHLLVGPWDHEGTAEHTDHAICIPLPPTAEHRWDAYQAFFDRYLMELPNGFGADGPVEVFTVGRQADGWRHLPDWPPPAMRPERWYLRAGGVLSAEPPTTAEAPDRYRYDPSDPVAETVGRTCWAIAAQLGDRRAIEERADVLSYTSLPLEADLELTGPLVASLHAASSAVDTDFTVTLVDVFPDGTASQIQAGIVRCRLRHGAFRPAPLAPGTVAALDVDLYPTSYLVPRGHRLRVDVSSSLFDRYDRNPNTGERMGAAAATVVADQEIHHSAAHPSHIVLPVLPGA